MKTITEYKPLIFGELIALSDKRKVQRRRWNRSGTAIAAYCVAGLWISVNTGLGTWNWQFWMMFGPLFIAGELASRIRLTRS